MSRNPRPIGSSEKTGKMRCFSEKNSMSGRRIGKRRLQIGIFHKILCIIVVILPI